MGGDTPAQSGDALFRDTFLAGQTGDWLLEEDDLGSSAVVNEQMVLTVNQPNTIQYTTLSEPTFSDFVVEVEARQRSGEPESSYGLLVRMQSGGQAFYRFEITGNGMYMIERRDVDGSWQRLIPDWTPSAAINQGLNVANRLKVIASGPTMAFFVNEIPLQQVTDAAFTSGNVGLDAGTFHGSALQVSFDDLAVYGSASEGTNLSTPES